MTPPSPENQTQADPAGDQTTKPDRRGLRLALLGIALVVVVAGVGIFWFFGGEPPAEVDLAATASAVAPSTEPTSGSDSAPDSTANSIEGIEGTWTVDTSLGEFTLEDTTSATFAGFRINEVLASVGEAVAVGRTPAVSGSAVIEGTTLASADFTVDLTAIVSDQSRREGAIQRSLNTGSHPEATFVLSEPIELGDQAVAGETVTAVATGEMTINGVTNPVEVGLEARLVDGAVLVTGTSEIVFADYDVTTPSAPMVVSVEDHGILEIQLWLTR